MVGYTKLSMALFAIFPALVRGHAAITSPPIRTPGNTHLANCGQRSFDVVEGDPTSPIEGQLPVGAGCEVSLCRGMVFEDQPTANVQAVAPGDSMTMQVDCTIPHGGPTNVTLVDTTVGGTGEVIGDDLAFFEDFCPTSGVTPADQSNLEFTLPNAATVGNRCQQAGDCVVQLFWATPDASQTYYYCVDVEMTNAAGSRRNFNSRVNKRQVKKPFKARGTNVFGKWLGA